MAVVKYDVEDVEAGGGGVQPQPGMYAGKIVSVNHRKKKTDGTVISDFEVVVDVGSEYARLWTYVKLPDDPNWEKSAHGWKLRELTDALGLPPKGGIDPKKIEGSKVLVKVKADTDQDGDYRGKIKNLFKPGEVDDGEIVNAGSANGDGDVTDYSGWDDDDLKAELAERGLKVSGRFSADKAIALLEESDGGGEAEEPEVADEGEVNLPEGYEDLDEWTTEDLKQELESKSIKLSGRYSDQKARDAIMEAIVGSDQETEEADGEAEITDDYDEWEPDELKSEIATRNEQGAEIKISGRQTKEKLIEALREDDKNADPF